MTKEKRQTPTQLGTRKNSKRADRRRTGFSLLELLAVITILGIVAMTITLGLKRPLQSSRFELLVDQIIDLDNRVRRRCETTSQHRQLLFDLNDHTIREVEGTVSSRKIELPSGCTIDQVLTAGKRIKRGQIVLLLDDMGSSTSYAVRVSGPSASRWLVCLGGTGQFFESESDNEVAGFFQRLYEARIDAD